MCVDILYPKRRSGQKRAHIKADIQIFGSPIHAELLRSFCLLFRITLMIDQ